MGRFYYSTLLLKTILKTQFETIDFKQLKHNTMKKNVFIISVMMYSSLAFSQAGINTPNPQGALHVDGAKDNVAIGTPTVVQQLNDFIVTNTGNVGIGTTSPAAKLDVNGNIKIADGSQGANKVLTSDANGVASWRTATVDNTVADPFTNPYLIASGGTNIAYAGGAGWTEGGTGVNCLLNESVDTHNVYNPSTGIVTISENGFYLVRPEIAYSNVPATGSVFDGTSGKWDIYLNLKANGAPFSTPIAIKEAIVTRGITSPGINGWYLDASTTIYLKAGDQISVTFHTYGTNNMNANTNNVIYRRSVSSLTLYKF